jgi:alpha-tubulin suppressor-like RCC1 family protein
VQVAELGTDVRYLVTGSSHPCARKTDGTLWCWGANQYGQLGTGDTEPRASPVQIDPENLGGNVDVVVAGAFHTCVTRTDSTMWCWGANQFGQLGVAGSMPRLVPVPLDFPDLAGGVPLVSAGGFHTCAAKTDGSLSCWGSNREGQLGSGTVENSATPLEVEADSFGRSTAVVYAGGAHTCARSSDSSLWCWGSNQFGQLGIGLGPGTNTPIRVSPACF